MSIPKSSSSPTTEDKFLMCKLEISNDFTRFCVRYESSNRNFYYEILCTFSMHILSSSAFSFFGFDNFFMTKVHKGGLMGSSKKDNISSVSSVTTIGTSFWNVFFFSPRNRSVSSFSGFELYLYFIDKHFLQLRI